MLFDIHHHTLYTFTRPVFQEPHTLRFRPRVDGTQSLDAFEPAPVGCSDLSEADPSHAATLGAVALDSEVGRTAPEQITVYKAMGHGMEDMIAANLVYTKAVQSAPIQTMTW